MVYTKPHVISKDGMCHQLKLANRRSVTDNKESQPAFTCGTKIGPLHLTDVLTHLNYLVTRSRLQAEGNKNMPHIS